ncbi:MAG: hypothetical protein LBE95_00245, partial [Holosporaceae bacterium]|nr:hypothetical protein [Holosporaceae bacterium]
KMKPKSISLQTLQYVGLLLTTPTYTYTIIKAERQEQMIIENLPKISAQLAPEWPSTKEDLH